MATSPAVPPSRPSRGVRSTLYVDTPGAVVRRRRRHFLVEGSDGEGGRTRLLSVPVPEVDALALVGRVHCTMPALRLCLRRGVQVVLLSRFGKVKGRLTPTSTADVATRMAQYAILNDRPHRLQIGRAVVGAKLHNMEHRLRRTARRRPNEQIDSAARAIARLAQQLAGADTIEALRGLEGAATRAYFGAWPALIRRPEPAFRFPRRSRRPPQDAVNALLGFTYSLLQKDVHAACVIAGLDPQLGVFHAPRRGLPAMAFDLMEAFRPVVADSVVLALINRGALEPGHFEARDGGVYLTEEGRKRVYAAYGRRRGETATLPGTDRSLPYYRAFEAQAHRMATALEGGDAYRAFRLR